LEDVSADAARDISGKRCGHGVSFRHGFETVKADRQCGLFGMGQDEEISQGPRRSRRNVANRRGSKALHHPLSFSQWWQFSARLFKPLCALIQDGLCGMELRVLSSSLTSLEP
jgi:hypothetical protein